MSMRIPRWVLGVSVAAAVVGSGVVTAGIVSAASTTAGSTTSSSSSASSTPQKPLGTFLRDLASHLGVSVSTLQSALKQTEIDQVQHLQQSGKITASRAQTIEQRIQAGTGLPLPFGTRPAPGRGMRPGPVSVWRTASQYLGLTSAQLRTDLRSGQSLDAIANAQSGKSAAGLKAALISAAQTALQKQVTAGRITATQEQTRLTAFEHMLTNLLTRTGLAAGPHRPWRAGRRGPWRDGNRSMGAGSSGSSSASTGSSTSASATSGSSSGA